MEAGREGGTPQRGILGGVTFPPVTEECQPVSHGLAAKKNRDPPPSLPSLTPQDGSAETRERKFSFPTPLWRFLPFVSPPWPGTIPHRAPLFPRPPTRLQLPGPAPPRAQMWGTGTGVTGPEGFGGFVLGGGSPGVWCPGFLWLTEGADSPKTLGEGTPGWFLGLWLMLGQEGPGVVHGVGLDLKSSPGHALDGPKSLTCTPKSFTC